MFDFRNSGLFKAIQLPFRKTRSPVEAPLSQPLGGSFNNNREPRKGPGLNVRWADRPHHGDANIVVLISISYSGIEWLAGRTMQLDSVKNDASLLLRHLQYRHKHETRRFFIITDFDFEYVDSSGLSNAIPTIPATRHNIETLTLGIMRDLQRHDKCLFYFRGHLELDPPLVDPSFGQHILLPKNDKIYGHEFRRWLSQAKFASTVIVVTLDACHSGEFLGLEYSYSDGIWTQTLATADDKMTSLVIEIASATKPGLSFSDCYSEDPNTPGVPYGVLTWHLVQLLKDKPEIRLLDLVSFLRSKCDILITDDQGQESHQSPQISSSRIVKGSVTLF